MTPVNSNEGAEEKQLGNAGCIGIGFSFLFPIVGIIMYFAMKNKVKNPGNYLTAAIISVVIGLAIRIML